MFMYVCMHVYAFQVVLMVKNPPVNARDLRDAGSIPGSGRSPGEGNGNLLQLLQPTSDTTSAHS